MNNRDWATLIWLAIGVLLLSLSKGVRSSVPGVIRAFLEPKIVVPWLAMLAGIAGLAALGDRFELWNEALPKDTVVWTVGPAFGLFFRIGDAGKEGHFFRRAAVDTVKYSVFVEFYLNLFVFGLLAELAFVPLLTFLGLLWVVATTKEEFHAVKTLLDWLLTLVAIGLTYYVTSRLINDWPPADATQDVRR